MPKTFCNQITEDIFHGKVIGWLDTKLAKRARRRLEILNGATQLEDMYFPPSNRFHSLQGFAPTRYAIWVDKQWRVTFEWVDGHAFNVCFEDYHS